ncbi:hypothetical protein [Streptomyces canus]|uniref:hypothetical protein n=1 Tax=Streptomyces canus TaxID=58343 RepID=UPI0030DF3FA9
MRYEFEAVPLVRPAPHIAAAVAAWAASAPVCALVRSFAATPADRRLAEDLSLGRGDLAERLARLDRFSDIWDARRGLERNQATVLGLAPAQRRLAHAAAEALGMRDAARPRFHSYDHLLVLGGSVRGCLARTAYAAHLAQSGQVGVGRVTALGGHRPFVGDEHRSATAAGVPQLSDEYAALTHGTSTAFGLTDPHTEDGDATPSADRWAIRRYRTADSLPVDVVAAVSGAPAERRANTADTFAFFVDRLAEPRPGTRLLLVTSPINVPAQHASAVGVLGRPFGAVVDTVGTPPEFVPPALARRFGATEYLMEIRSTIRSLRRLLLADQSPRRAPRGAGQQ